MSGTKTYLVEGESVDVDEKDVAAFTSKFPSAIEAKSFIVEGDTVDVETKDVDVFLKKFPSAKPTFDEPVKKKVGAGTVLQEDIPPVPLKSKEPYSASEQVSQLPSGSASPSAEPTGVSKLPKTKTPFSQAEDFIESGFQVLGQQAKELADYEAQLQDPNIDEQTKQFLSQERDALATNNLNLSQQVDGVWAGLEKIKSEKRFSDVVKKYDTEYQKKAKEGSVGGALWNSLAEGYTKTVDSFEKSVGVTFAYLYPEATGRQTRDDAVKQVLEAGEITGTKKILDEKLKIKGTTPEYVEALKESGIVAQGVFGLAESVYPMITPQMSGMFAIGFADGVKEIDTIKPDISTEGKLFYGTAQGAVQLALERFGFSNVLKNKSVVKSLTDRVVKETMSEGLKKVTGNTVLKTAAKIVTGASAEFETGATQYVAEEGIRQAADLISGQDDFEFEGGVDFIANTLKSGATEAIGGGIISTAKNSAGLIKNSKIRKEAQGEVEKINVLQKDISNPDISPEAKEGLAQSVQNLSEQVLESAYTDKKETENLPDASKNKIQEIDNSIALKEIVLLDEKVSDAAKEITKNDISELEKEREKEIKQPPHAEAEVKTEAEKPKPKEDVKEEKKEGDEGILTPEPKVEPEGVTEVAPEGDMLKNVNLKPNDNINVKFEENGKEETILDRLSQEEEQGRSIGGRILTWATRIAEGSHRASEADKTIGRERKIKKNEEKEIESFAKSNGGWIDLKTQDIGEKFEGGTEQDVFLNKDGKSVTKINGGNHHNTWLDFFDRIAIHNALFPETKYTVRGFTIYKDKFSAVLEQPYIKAERAATKEEIKKDMNARGFTHSFMEALLSSGGYFSNKTTGVVVKDLRGTNVIVDKAGNLFYVDPVIEIYSPEIGGARIVELNRKSQPISPVQKKEYTAEETAQYEANIKAAESAGYKTIDEAVGSIKKHGLGDYKKNAVIPVEKFKEAKKISEAKKEAEKKKPEETLQEKKQPEFQEHITIGKQAGKYVVEKTDDGVKIFNSDTGKEVKLTKQNQWAVEQYVEANLENFRSGEKAELPEGIQTESEASKIVAKESNNPEEIASAWLNSKQNADRQSMTFKEAVFEAAHGIDADSFREYYGLGKKNVAGELKKRLKKEGGVPLDVIAERVKESMELSEEQAEAIESKTGKESEVIERIIDFLTSSEFENYKPGAETATEISLSQKFQEITGLPLSEKTAKVITDYRGRVEKLADRIDAYIEKIPDAGVPFIIAPKLLKIGLQSVSASLRAGIAINRAINIAIRAIQKALGKDEKFGVEEQKEFADIVNKKIGEQKEELKKAEAISRPMGIKETKAAVKEITEPAEKKVTMTEKQGLKKQIRDFIRGMKEGISDEKIRAANKADNLKDNQTKIIELLTDAKNKKHLSQRSLDTILKRLAKAKTENNFDKLSDYIEKALDIADYAEQMEGLRKLQSDAGKRKHPSMDKAVKEFLSINPEKLPADMIPKYKQALDELSGRVPSYKAMTDMFYDVAQLNLPKPDTYDAVKTFAEANEKYTEIGLNKVSSIEDYRKLFKDISAFKNRVNKLLENGDITEQQHSDLMEQVGKDQSAVENKYASEITSLKTDLINELRDKTKSVGLANLSTESKKLLQKYFELDNNDLRNLSPEELYNLSSVLDNVIDDGFVDVFRLNPIVIKAQTGAKAEANALQIAKAKSFEDAVSAEKSETKERALVAKLSTLSSAFWEGAMGLGKVAFGSFHKTIISPMQRAAGNYIKFIDEGSQKITELKKKYKIEPEQMNKLGMTMMYLREFALQHDPKYKGKKDKDGTLYGTRDWFKNMLESETAKTKISQKEYNEIKKAWGEMGGSYTEINGKFTATNSISPDAIYDSWVNNKTDFISANEMSFLKDMMKWKDENMTGKQKYANELRGKPFDELLFHIKRIRKDGKELQGELPFDVSESGNMRIAAGSGKSVLTEEMGAIETNFEKIFIETLEENARDYYFTPMLQEVNAVMKATKKQLPENKKAYMDVASANMVEAMNNEFSQPEGLKFLRTLMKAKAAQIFINIPRTAIETISALSSYPAKAKSLNAYKEIFRPRKTVRDLFEYTESPLRNRKNLNKHLEMEKGTLKPKGMFEKTSHYLASLPELLALEPVWMATFKNSFEAETGIKFSESEYQNNPKYKERFNKYIKSSASVADATYERIAGSTTAAGQRRTIKILPTKVSKAFGFGEGLKAKTTAGSIASFMTGYTNREFLALADSFSALHQAAKDSQYSKSDAAKTLLPALGIVAGNLIYNYLQQLSFATQNLVLGDDDEEAKKELDKLLSPEGVLTELGVSMLGLVGSKYSGMGRQLIKLGASVAYNLADKKDQPALKAIIRNISYSNPISISEGYGFKGKVAIEFADAIIPISVVINNINNVVKSAGGAKYLWEKVEKGELLTEPEKEAVYLMQLSVNVFNLIAMSKGAALPATTINRMARDIKEEKKIERKKPATPQEKAAKRLEYREKKKNK